MLRIVKGDLKAPDVVETARDRLRQGAAELMAIAIAAEDMRAAGEAQIISMLLNLERR